MILRYPPIGQFARGRGPQPGRPESAGYDVMTAGPLAWPGRSRPSARMSPSAGM